MTTPLPAAAPGYGSPAAAPFEALLTAMRAELAALDDGDPQAIVAATNAKIVALTGVQDGGPYSRAALEAARSLNALAGARVNMLMAGVARRRDALAAAHGAAPRLVYGRAGQGFR